MHGEGPYDGIAEDSLLRTEADAVIVIVLGGNRGNGFSLTAQPYCIAGGALAQVPDVLRQAANEIEADLRAPRRPAGRG